MRVVVVTVSDGRYSGRGEAVHLARYGQSVASVLAQIESLKGEKSVIDDRPGAKSRANDQELRRNNSSRHDRNLAPGRIIKSGPP